MPSGGTFVAGRTRWPRRPETGLGEWTTDEILTVLTTGERPDGRILAPIVPYHAIAQLTDADVRAMALYLKSVSR